MLNNLNNIKIISGDGIYAILMITGQQLLSAYQFKRKPDGNNKGNHSPCKMQPGIAYK
jgi:hypothetical protein